MPSIVWNCNCVSHVERRNIVLVRNIKWIGERARIKERRSMRWGTGKLIVGEVKETEELVGRKEREKARCGRPWKINRWKKCCVC